MTDSEKIKRLAKKLLELSKEGDRVSAERVKAVLESLRDRTPQTLKPLLKKYLNYVTREIERSTATVYYAGKPGESAMQSIKDLLAKEYDRAIEINCVEDRELVAGVKIRIADDVWDEDVATHLENFKQA